MEGGRKCAFSTENWPYLRNGNRYRSTHLIAYHLIVYPIYLHEMPNDKTKKLPFWAKYARLIAYRLTA